MAFLVEKLDVYQKALNFAEAIGKVTEGFPRGQWYLADQLNRAATSIPANEEILQEWVARLLSEPSGGG